MAGARGVSTECFRIPPGVEFQRWQGGEEWVLYHSGTGETMRLSDAAVAVLDLIVEAHRLDRRVLANGLNTLMDVPLPDAEIDAALEQLLRELLSHECLERVACD